MNATRNESFVPLTAAAAPAAERPDFRLTVMSHPDNAQPFHSLGQMAAAASSGHATGTEPRVTLEREGDRVSLIRILCTCGQTIELACAYEPAPAPAPAPAATSEPGPEIPAARAPESAPGPAPAPTPGLVSAPATAPKHKAPPEKSGGKKGSSRSKR